MQKAGGETAKVSAMSSQPPTSLAKEQEKERDPPSSGGKNCSAQCSPPCRSQASKPLPSLIHSLL